MPREPRQADFRRRENLDLVPERTELSCDLTGGEPGPFREQDAHGGSLALIGGEIHVATKLRCSLMSEMRSFSSFRRSAHDFRSSSGNGHYQRRSACLKSAN